MPRLAILIDGEFMKKRLGRTLRRFPTIADFRVERQEILDAYAASPLQPDSDLLHPLPGGPANFTRRDARR